MADTTPAAKTATTVVTTTEAVPASDSIFAFQAFCYQRIEPKGRYPCRYLESPQKLPAVNTLEEAMYKWPERLIARENGGTSNNHVQWIPCCKLKVYSVTQTALAHGVLVRDSGEHHKKGDKLWLLSEYPLLGEGGRMVKVINLDKIKETDVLINDVKWRPDKRWIASRGLHLTFAGPVWPGSSGVLGMPPYRMCVQFRPGAREGGEDWDDQEGDGDDKYLMVRLGLVQMDCEDVTPENMDELPEGGVRRGLVSTIFGWLRRGSSGDTATNWSSSSARRNSRPQLS
ncbi:hypothetical protein QBC44DRAFT_88792 [Cladorrhinum sp. PSN332]|nr:hypothetical protein QBC44DRAFT_88792 [Cladorrhinum sp. PSN332]